MATPFSTTKSAIRKRLNDAAIGIPLLQANMAKESVRDGAGNMPLEFMILEVVFSDAFQASMGTTTKRRHKYTGYIYVHVFTQLGVGDGRSLLLCDNIASIFFSQAFNGVLCRASSIDAGGNANASEGQYWRNTVATPFEVTYYQ